MLGVEIMHRGSAQVAAPWPPDFDTESSRLAQLGSFGGCAGAVEDAGGGA
jgi:hypothetical protein